MKTIMWAALFVSLVASATAAEQDGSKFDEGKLIGKWEPTEAKKDTRATIEFKKGGKLLVTVPVDGMDTVLEGTWKLKGAELEIGLMKSNAPETTTFKLNKLDDKTLEYTAPQGKTYTLKRLKS